jgi:hypothetical protein
MTISIYEGRRYDPQRFVRLMSMLNIAMAICVLFAWPYIAGVLSDPMMLASGEGISSRPSLDEYPYVVLWLLPLLCVIVSWIATTIGFTAFAKFVLAYPVMLYGCSIFWYHYLSQYYL